jgi:ribose transport system substrate-binding protein
MTKSKLWVVPALAAMVIAAGCGSSSSDSSTSGGGGGGSSTSSSSGGSSSTKGDKVAYISPVAAQPGQQEINLGLDRASKQLGWTNAVLDSALSADKQVANIDTAITQKRNAIASWTLDPGAAAGAYGRALAAGIPVIGMNSEGDGVSGTVWWQYERCDAGGPADQTADMIKKVEGAGAKTIIIGGPPAPSIVGQVKCFTAAAKKAGLTVIATTNNTADTASGAQQIMSDLLTKHPDVQAVWNYNDQSALGDSAAITGAGKKIASADGKTKGIFLIGHNGDHDAITAVKQGRMTGTWDPDNLASGMAAAKLMQTAIAGGAEKKYPALIVKSTLWTNTNIDQYKPAAERNYTLDNLRLVTGSSR